MQATWDPVSDASFTARDRNLLANRLATRYDKFAANYLAFIQVASIRLWLHVNPPSQH
jgi:transposase